MLVPSPKWLDTGNNAWQLAAATFVGLQSIPGLAVLYGGYRQEEMGDQFCLHVLLRLRLGLGRVDLVRLQHGVRRTVVSIPRQAGAGDLGEFHLGPGDRTGRGRRHAGTDLPDGHPDVLPVRVRRDHRDHPRRLGARPHELHGLGDLLPGVDDPGLHGRGVQPLGRRLARRLGVADFSGGYVIHLAAGTSGFRRRGGDRAAPAGRSRQLPAQQPAGHLDRRRHPVARVERVQRRRPLLRQRRRRRGRAQHQHRHRRWRCSCGR